MGRHDLKVMKFSAVYPLYVAKAERKGRHKEEVDEIILWLTGCDHNQLEALIDSDTNFEELFNSVPKLNPSRELITGVVCGVRVEEINDPLLREIRRLDKLIDELAKGWKMEKILRKQT